jgi:hypothetical protein
MAPTIGNALADQTDRWPLPMALLGSLLVTITLWSLLWLVFWAVLSIV